MMDAASPTSVLHEPAHRRMERRARLKPGCKLGRRPQRVLIIFNGRAGGGRRSCLERAVARLEEHGCAITIRETHAPGDAEAFARSADEADFDAVVAAGGDGTINAVVNGFKETTMPLGVIRLGTANVLAAELGLPETPEEQADVIAQGVVQPVHVGLANDRRFLMMAGVGFDAHVVDQMDRKLKRKLGKMAFLWRAIVAVFRYPYGTYRLLLDGRPYEAASAIIANGRHYGGTYVCAPEARLEDRGFHVCLFKSKGPLSAIRYGIALIRGRLHARSDFEVIRARSVVIEGRADEPVQGDGDVIVRLPLTAVSCREPVNLLIPA